MKPQIQRLTTALAVLFAPLAAAADPVCMVQDEMEAALIDWYGERPVSPPSETKQVLWVSQETGTWTLIRPLSDGTACVIAQGDDWNPGQDADQMLAQLDD